MAIVYLTLIVLSSYNIFTGNQVICNILIIALCFRALDTEKTLLNSNILIKRLEMELRSLQKYTGSV